jgi:hypothetical protein
VYDKTLYAEEIPVQVYQNAEDSAYAVKTYIDQWLRKQVFIKFAEQNVDTAYVNRLLNQYREDLLRDLYENRLKSKLRDKIRITEEELSAYYNEQKKNFPAKDTLIKWQYLILDNKEKDRYKISKLFFSDKAEDREKLETYYPKFLAVKIDTSGWTTYAGAKKIVPPLPKTLRNNTKYTLSRKNRLYLVRISKTVLPGETAPFEYIKNQLKKFVTERKLQKEIQKTRNDMLKQAYKKQQIKHYNQ